MNVISLAKARRERAERRGATGCDAARLAIHVGRMSAWELHGGKKPKPLGTVHVCAQCAAFLAARCLDAAGLCMGILQGKGGGKAG